MEQYISTLVQTKLFSGIEEEEIAAMLSCLSAVMKTYAKGEYIFKRESRITSVAMLLEGVVHIQQEDYWGNLSILSEVSQGEIFGEVYACLGSEEMQNNAVAVKSSTVLFLDINRVLTICPSACDFPQPSDTESAFHNGTEKSDADQKDHTYVPADNQGEVTILPVGTVRESRKRSF